MYDIPELERKWRKYRRNKIKKPLIIITSTIVGIGVVSAIILTYSHFSKNKTQAKVIAQKETTNVETNKPVIKSNPNPAPIVITKNSLNNTQQNSVETIDISKAKIITPDVSDDDVRMIGFDTNSETTSNKSDILISSQKQKEIQELEHIKEVEERFKSSQDPHDSLFLAKYYYKKGNYAKAVDWAINTNNIDGSIEESWIIFAKAQAKMGHRVDAIKALQSYYDSTGSMKAKKLLDKLRLGKPFN